MLNNEMVIGALIVVSALVTSEIIKFLLKSFMKKATREDVMTKPDCDKKHAEILKKHEAFDKDIKDITEKQTTLRVDLPKEYVRNVDYSVDIKEIKSMLSKIFDKLDQKADKV